MSIVVRTTTKSNTASAAIRSGGDDFSPTACAEYRGDWKKNNESRERGDDHHGERVWEVDGLRRDDACGRDIALRGAEAQHFLRRAGRATEAIADGERTGDQSERGKDRGGAED